MKHIELIITLFLSLIISMPLLAETGNAAASVIDAAIDAGFSEVERQIIATYYQDKTGDRDEKSKKEKKNKKEAKKAPPGLAKKESLPPGLARQLERNGTLPPGLAKRELPNDLEKQLPKLNETLERTIVDASVVLVEKATGRIIDIIRDVVTN